MDFDWILKPGMLLVLLLGSAFFSGSEVALFSLDKKKVEKNFRSNNILKRYLLNLINYPRRLLVTVLIGNTIVNVAASIVAVFIAFDAASYFLISTELALAIQIILLTILVLIFGELFPKITANRNPVLFSKIICIPMYFFSLVIFPISEFITEIIRLSVSKLKIDKSKSAISSDEIAHLSSISHEKGKLEEKEHNLINSLVNFGSVTVEEIMIPRVDMVTVSTKVNYEELLQIITQSGHSRIPLYKNNLDEIVGVIYAKDLLPYSRKPGLREHLSLTKISRKPLFIPESKLISELLKEFQEKKMHLAIVVDEYGGTSGLVTLEDIIEEVVGEIWDEYDRAENPVMIAGENKWIVLGKAPIDIVNELTGSDIRNDEDDFDTLGGFVLNQAGSIPSENFEFLHNGFRYIVKEVQQKRIKKILIDKI